MGKEEKGVLRSLKLLIQPGGWAVSDLKRLQEAGLDVKGAVAAWLARQRVAAASGSIRSSSGVSLSTRPFMPRGP